MLLRARLRRSPDAVRCACFVMVVGPLTTWQPPALTRLAGSSTLGCGSRDARHPCPLSEAPAADLSAEMTVGNGHLWSLRSSTADGSAILRDWA